MWTSNQGSIGRRFVLLIGQLITLFLCFTYIDYIYLHTISPDKHAKATFRPIPCLLISEKMSARAGLFREYRADFLISYNVKGTQYSRWVSGNGLSIDYSRDPSLHEKVLSQYAPGSTYTCYYDPDNASVAVLKLRHHWNSSISLLLPSLIFIITLYYLILNIYILIRDD